MKKRILLIVLMMVFAFFYSACEQQEELVLPVQEETMSNNPDNQSPNVRDTQDIVDKAEVEQYHIGLSGFLWETSSGNTTVYLLGTTQAATAELYPLRAEILEAFEQADYLVVEVDYFNIDEEYFEMVQELATYSNTTLEEQVASETYEKLNEVLKRYYLRASQFNEYRPIFLNILLEERLMQEQDVNHKYLLDYYFLTHTKEHSILQIESSIDYMKRYLNLSHELQEYMLNYRLDNMDTFLKDYFNQIVLWHTGDLQGYENWMNATYRSTPKLEEFYSAIYLEKNVSIAEQLKDFIQAQEGKTYFVVLGAQHNVGENGIIQLLEEQGYELRRK